MRSQLVQVDELEPQRFEDLVRHLAYGFRRWRSLEGERADLTGVELAGASRDDDLEATVVERRWRIHGKRIKSLTAKAIKKTVQDLVADAPEAPHGLLVAVSATASRDVLAAFHEEAKRLGVREAHLWTRAAIEEALHRPENDLILFTYFGVSLHPRRRDRVRAVARAVEVKRLLLAALGAAETSDLKNHPLLVRSVVDETYPAPPPGEGATRAWHFARAFAMTHDELGVEIRDWAGVRRRDGTWDRDDATGDWAEAPTEGVREDRRVAVRERRLLEALVPAEERARVVAIGWIPLARIAVIDPIGLPGAGTPHIHCDFGIDLGPYARIDLFAQQTGWTSPLDESKRDPSIFAALRSTADLSDEAYARYRDSLFG